MRHLKIMRELVQRRITRNERDISLDRDFSKSFFHAHFADNAWEANSYTPNTVHPLAQLKMFLLSCSVIIVRTANGALAYTHYN